MPHSQASGFDGLIPRPSGLDGYLVSLFLAVLLSLQLVTILMFFVFTHAIKQSINQPVKQSTINITQSVN